MPVTEPVLVAVPDLVPDRDPHCLKNASQIPLNFREGADAMCVVTQIFATASLWSRGELLQRSQQFGMPSRTN